MRDFEQLEQLEKPFQLDSAGWMNQKDGSKLLIELNDENNHLAFYNRLSEQTEIAYQQSAIVVDLLEILLLKKAEADKHSYRGKLAFFDTKGKFYNFALLEELNPEQHTNNLIQEKHNAVFSFKTANGTSDRLTIAIDDIYCVSLAQYPMLGWRGDDS